MNIREASGSDLEDVLKVEYLAFGKSEEADLVRDLLQDPTAKPTLSLLAFEDNEAVGHILFTKVSLEPTTPLSLSLLAPLAIIPEYQNKGIGRQLIENGLELLRESKVDLVFVLGHPAYYSRFGFQPAGKLGFEASYPILEKNADAWMVIELQPNTIGKFKGKVICADMLNKPEYWQE